MISLYPVPNPITQHRVVTATQSTLADDNRSSINVTNREVSNDMAVILEIYQVENCNRLESSTGGWAKHVS